MRLFTYVCPHCLGLIERDVPGTEPPPDKITEPHPCANSDGLQPLLRQWQSARLNLGFRPVVHDNNDLWKFQNG